MSMSNGGHLNINKLTCLLKEISHDKGVNMSVLLLVYLL